MGGQYFILIMVPMVVIGGIIIAIISGLKIADGEYMMPAVLVGAPVFMLVLHLLSWQPVILCFFTLHLAGSIPLARNLSPSDIMMVFTFLWFTINSVILRKQNIHVYNWPLFLFLFIIVSIIFINFVRGGGGFRMFGSETWGGRKYFNTFLGLSFYLVLCMWRPSLVQLNRIPYLVFAAYSVDFAVWLVQYFAPSAIPTMYPFYTGIQVELFADSLALEPTAGVQRLFGFRTIGLGLIILCLSTSNFKNFLSPKNLIYLFILIPGGLACVAMAGFRSYLALGIFMVGLGAILRMKWLSFVPAILGGVLLTLLIAGNGKVYDLPIQVQRTLSWLPGEWDRLAVSDAQGSTDWRKEIWKVWYERYFPENPLIGRGWNINAKDTFGSDGNISIQDVQSSEETYALFASIGALHNGPLSAIDVTGILGFIFVVLSSCFVIFYMWRRAREIGFLELQPVQRFVLINLTSWIVLFFFLDGFFERFIDYYFIMCGLSAIAFNKAFLEEQFAPREIVEHKQSREWNPDGT